MENLKEKNVMRAQDFWTALILIALSGFFLWKTSEIPIWEQNIAGVSSTGWYNSAAIVPLFIFFSLLILSFVLLTISIRSGGARDALTAVGIGWNRAEALRVATIGLIIFAYLVGLVPRVDFILCSGLVITALIFGYYGGHAWRALVSSFVVAAPGSFAFFGFRAQVDWSAHIDDWVTLTAWVLLMGLVVTRARNERVLRAAPIIAVLAPFVLVCAMAFGFRQNVPARGGLIFKQIEYHYFVTLRPLWRE